MLKEITNIRDKLIVGLDVSDIKQAEQLVKFLSKEISFYKIGYQLVFSGGLELARDLAKDGKKIFLDVKLLDIDNTVAKAVDNIIKLNINMLTLHAYPKVMQAAKEAAEGSDICLLAVTVLTAMDDHDLNQAGYNLSVNQLVEQRCRQAKQIGMGGVVASAVEARRIRQIIGDEMALVTPGIRPVGAEKYDQKRVVTPREAIDSGASHIVVGRPIIYADDPLKNAIDILSEIGQN